jgi:uncharacterized membrane protein
MLHATLKSIHLLAMFVWLGGMFFTLVCLRPALGVLEPPPLRLRLMNAVLGRFFAAVSWAAGLMLVTGVLMLPHGASSGVQPVPAITAMAALGIVMIGVFVFVRLVPFRRLQAALAEGDAPGAAAALNGIRVLVVLNLAIGGAIVLITQFLPLA